ncbi:hypothetical protein [Rhizobium sp. CNPSo 4039]|uniref:hypothetical protein n=1 Tax=Rhizobium sp. CNPSo 4039 TaxID=3021409 RepID=UPI0025507F53|nr:hypothetical protein [Rhizobium sp. CNPSo 4039]MDK4716632.1 hypothetical protein [Rhizobium sp. CNPSo 4039]
MKQADRMNSTSNDWEADPWDATDEVADLQFAGFQNRAAKAIAWASIFGADQSLFGMEASDLRSFDAEFYATCDGEDMLLMRLIWHGFPDPPEWRLATRPSNRGDLPWASWGYFADLPESWRIPASQAASSDNPA